MKYVVVGYNLFMLVAEYPISIGEFSGEANATRPEDVKWSISGDISWESIWDNLANFHGQFSIQELGMIYYIIFLAWIMDMLVLTNYTQCLRGQRQHFSTVWVKSLVLRISHATWSTCLMSVCCSVLILGSSPYRIMFCWLRLVESQFSSVKIGDFAGYIHMFLHRIPSWCLGGEKGSRLWSADGFQTWDATDDFNGFPMIGQTGTGIGRPKLGFTTLLSSDVWGALSLPSFFADQLACDQPVFGQSQTFVHRILGTGVNSLGSPKNHKTYRIGRVYS